LQNPSKFVKCKNSDQTTVPSQVAASQCYHLCRSTSDVIRVSAGDMNRSARNKHFSLLSLTVDRRSFSPESTVCLVGEPRERERICSRGCLDEERWERSGSRGNIPSRCGSAPSPEIWRTERLRSRFSHRVSPSHSRHPHLSSLSGASEAMAPGVGGACGRSSPSVLLMV
jgi:hypothetical protein